MKVVIDLIENLRESIGNDGRRFDQTPFDRRYQRDDV